MSANPLRSVPGISPEEWKVRVELAALYRLCHMEGWTDMTSTHISARVPGPEHHFLINPHGMLYDEINASCLIKVDMEGNKITPSDYRVNRAGFVIHSAIHMARPDGMFVLHTHTPACTAVGSQKNGLLPWTQHSLAILGDVAYHGFEGVAVRMDERQSIAADIGDKRILFLRNHGLLTMGMTAGEAFMNAFRAERACRHQLAMQQSGAEILPIPDSVIEWSLRNSKKAYFPGGSLDPNVLEWPALMRRLERLDPSYKD